MSESIELDARDTERFVLHETAARRFVLSLARLIFPPFMDLRVEGVANVPAEGAFILASNHLSNWDVFAMQLALPRTIFFMAKAELFRLPPMAMLLRDFGAFPVYRGEKDAWALQHARRVLEAGQVLGMFPEGHRSKGTGLLPARTGTAGSPSKRAARSCRWRLPAASACCAASRIARAWMCHSCHFFIRGLARLRKT